MKKLTIATCIFASLVIMACAPKVSMKTVSKSQPLPSSCAPTFLELSDPEPKNAKHLATVAVGDTGFSTNCGKENSREIVRKKACQVGANLVKIVAVSEPNNWHGSDCYRIKAKLYYTNEVKGDKHGNKDKVEKLKDLQSLYESGVINEQELKDLKSEIME